MTNLNKITFFLCGIGLSFYSNMTSSKPFTSELQFAYWQKGIYICFAYNIKCQMSKNMIHLRALQVSCESIKTKNNSQVSTGRAKTSHSFYSPLLMLLPFFQSPVPEPESSLTLTLSHSTPLPRSVFQVPTLYLSLTVLLYAKIIQFSHFITNIF